VELYLAQHGEARPESEDPARPLSDRGRRDVEDVARTAARLGLGVTLIQHSGKLRAQQTADLFAAALRPVGGVREMAGLAPNDDPGVAARAVAAAREPWLLVGHLPHLSRLASLLVADDGERALVAFRMSALVGLVQDGEAWRLRFILTPEIARALASSPA
jgi:phosphohistidine phosphatase